MKRNYISISKVEINAFVVFQEALKMAKIARVEDLHASFM